MEILNNIWTAISTPNELLINIITIPLYFVENFLTLYVFLSISKIKCTLKSKVLYVIVMSIIAILTTKLLSNPFNIYTNYVLILVIANLIFRKSIIKTTVSLILTLIVFNLVSSLILNPFISILNISTNELGIIPIYRLLYMISLYFITFLLGFLFSKINLQLNFLEFLDTKNKIIILSNLVCGIITIVTQSIILYYYVDILPLFLTFLSFITLLAYFIFSLYTITRIFKLFQTNQKLETAEEYNKRLNSINDSISSFKHDFDNTLTTIGGFIRTDDMEGLKKYYYELEDDSQKVNNLYILNPEVVNNNGIYNLITQKYSKAEEKDIKVNITFLLDLSTLKMKIYEFARILGILLDNAIEASAESNEKIINITFRNDIKNSAQIVTIENSYKDKNINTEEIFQKGITGKENHQGLGLWKVKKIVDKNSNVFLITNKNKTFFTQQLEIY